MRGHEGLVKSAFRRQVPANIGEAGIAQNRAKLLALQRATLRGEQVGLPFILPLLQDEVIVREAASE